VRLRLALAGIAAGTTLLAGCTGDDASADPSPDKTSSSSEPAEETTEPDVDAPELPEAATEQTYEGAEAFVAHFIETFNYAQVSGDVEPMRAISDPGCSSCIDLADLIEETYEAGGSSTGGGITLTGALSPLPADFGATFGIYSTATSEPQVITNADGSVDEFPGGAMQVYCYPSLVGNEWRMLWLRTPAA